jgi:hypothetical protein
LNVHSLLRRCYSPAQVETAPRPPKRNIIASAFLYARCKLHSADNWPVSLSA